MSFNIASHNISTQIFFLLFVFSFTSLDSILFGELFALLFFSKVFFTFLGIIGSFSSDLFLAVSDLAFM